jgi:hypothetical protein
MNIVIWIAQGLATIAFLGAGAMKLTQPYLKVAERMTWAKEFSPQSIQLIGLAEVLGALGLILPQLTNILPILTPIAAACLAILMGGAVYTHFRLHEAKNAVAPLFLLLLALLVAYGRL